MSVLGRIISAIFGHAGAAPAPAPAAPGAASHPAASAPAPHPPRRRSPAATVDVAAILTKLAASNKEKLDWQKSIVDLMKLLNLDFEPHGAQGAGRRTALYRRQEQFRRP